MSSSDYFNRYASQQQGATSFSSSSSRPIQQATQPAQSGNSQYNAVQQGQQGQQGQQANNSIEAKNAELEGDNSAVLKYASELNNGVIISGSSDYSKITSLKNAILELKSGYFSQNTGLSVRGENRD